MLRAKLQLNQKIDVTQTTIVVTEMKKKGASCCIHQLYFPILPDNFNEDLRQNYHGMIYYFIKQLNN